MRRWSSLLGGLGGVFVAFGAFSFVMALFQPVTDPAWVWGNLVLGVVLLAVSVATGLETIRERVRSGEGRRVGKYGVSALLSTLIGVAILVMIAFLSVRNNVKWDWSEQQVHTLTSQSLNLLEGLEREAEITAFFSELDAPPARDLLDRYAYASELVKLRFVDPNVQPGVVEELGIDEEKLARGLVRISIGEESVDIGEISEPEITNALLKLARGGEKKVYFVEGHNERPIDGEAGDGKEGMSRAADALRNETYQVEKLLLASVGEIPDDAEVVVVAGPTRPLLDHEHGALQRYLERGGALMVLVDPRANTDLYDDLRGWGIGMGDDVIVDQTLALFGRASSPFAGRYSGEHPITQGLRDPALFHVARSVEVLDDAADDLEVIVYTGENSWAERDLDSWRTTGRAAYGDDDLIGPVPVAAAGILELGGDGSADADDAASEGARARLVVFGDSDFATNELLDGFLNRDLFLNSVNWLMGDVEQISVRPALSRASRFQLSNEQFQMLRNLSLFLLPEGIAIVGVLVWWTRRVRAQD